MAEDASPSTNSGDEPERPFSLYVVNQFVDEDLQSVEKPIATPFKSLEGLLRRPAYLVMFLKHLHETQNCEATIPLLFMLRVGAYYHATVGLADAIGAKRPAQTIVQTFLSPTAPWPVTTEQTKMEETMEDLFKKTEITADEAANMFNSLTMEIAEVVASQLDAYQQSLKAEDDAEFVQEDIDQGSEYLVTQKLLSSLLPQTSTTAQDGSYIMLLTSVANSMGIDAKSTFQAPTSQRGQVGGGSVTSASSMFKVKAKHNVHIIMGHSFVATHYNSPTFCDFCNGLLWGIGNQGYTCQLCGYNVHKATCNQSITENCRGEPREGAASLFRRGSLKPSFSGSFRQGLRPTQSRSSVESDDSDISKRRLSSMSSSSTVCTESPMDGPDRQSSFAERGSNFYNLRRNGGGASRSDSDRSAGPSKILRAQSMKVNNNGAGEKIKPAAAHRDAVSSGRRSIDGMLEGPPMSQDENLSASFHRAFKDPDLAVDEDLVPWSIRTNQEHLAGLSKEEVKRQDLVHELVHTEQTHVKKLKVLLHVFYTPLANSDVISAKMADAVFPGLSELTEFHVDLMTGLKNCLDPQNSMRANAVGDVLVQFFSGEKSEQMQETASEWVKLRQLNLDYLKQYSGKNPKLGQLITQCEANPMCTRLKLPDLTSVVMQRFTKYPLLLESILKKTSSEACPQEHENLTKAAELCRRILARINQDVMNFENNRTLFELQNRIEFKNMDRLTGALSVYRGLDISNRELLHRDDLKCRLKGKLTSVDALLFPDILVLLEHNEDKSRYYLRIREESLPIITLKDLLPPREVASDKERKSFLLVWLTSSGSRMYEIAASSSDSSANWRIRISDAIAASKGCSSSNVISQSYTKNIKSYMLRAQARYRSMSSQDVLDPDHVRADDGSEDPGISPRSSLDNMASKYLDDPSLIGSPTLRGDDEKPDKHDKHSFRSAVLAATTFAPRSSASTRDKSPQSSPSVERRVRATSTNLTPSDLVAALEHCVIQAQSICTMAQEAAAKTENHTRTRSIRNRNMIQTADSSAARMVASIDTLRSQLKVCVELAKGNAAALSELKQRKESLETAMSLAASASVTSIAMPPGAELGARGLSDPPSGTSILSTTSNKSASSNTLSPDTDCDSPVCDFPAPVDLVDTVDKPLSPLATTPADPRSSHGSVSSLGSSQEKTDASESFPAGGKRVPLPHTYTNSMSLDSITSQPASSSGESIIASLQSVI